MKQTIKCLFAVLAAMLVAVSALAQVTTASLGGQVTEENGGPLEGVVVVATHTPSGTVYGAVTNESGRYSIQGMRSGGPYKVEISCMGYQTVTYTDVTLQLAETFNLNQSIKENRELIEQSMVIAMSPSKFSAEKTGAATNVSRSQIENLPTVNRNITDVSRLSPYGGNGMVFGGADGRTSNFTVDGANFNNNFGLNDGLPGGGSPISIDAIEEVQIIVSPYDVRQTNFIGGGMNAITKSGTNTFKGTAYVYHQNENMRGNMVYGQEVSGARDIDRKTTHGFTIGGPIIKNKLFFFANFEYTKTPSVANYWKASNSNKGVNKTITAINGKQYTISGPGTMDADNYVSAASRQDMAVVSQFVKDAYGYDTGSYTDFPADEDNMKILARIDWNISQNHKLAVRYNYTNNTYYNTPSGSSTDAGTSAIGSRTSKYSQVFANSMYGMNNRVHTASLDFNSRITDNISNQLLATFSKLDDVRSSGSSEFPFIDILDGTAEDPLTPYMSLGYELFTWKNAVHNTVFTLKDDVVMNLGTHKITGGLSYEYQMADNSYIRNGAGYYRYKSVEDFLTGATPDAVCLTYGYDGNDSPASRVRYHKVGLYGQDEWSVSDRFKLTYGLRLDGLFFDNADLMRNNAVYNLDYHNGKKIDTGAWPSSSITVSPRVGFNWDIIGDKSLIFRGGTGLFSGRLPLVFFTNMPSNSGMIQNLLIFNAKGDVDMNEFAGGLVTDANGKATIAALKNKLFELGYPETISPDEGTLPSQINAVDRKFKMPQVWKTSVAFDYSFPVSFPFSLSVEGIFNKTVNGVYLSDWSVRSIDGLAKFKGPDNRPIYENAKYTYQNEEGKTVNIPDSYVLSNTSQGYGYMGTVTLNMRPIECLSLMAAYTHTAAYELTAMPGSNAKSAFQYIPSVNGQNSPMLHAAENLTPDRFVASATLRDKGNNTFSLIYEAYRGAGKESYMYSNDMNGDGFLYDLIYIPTYEQIENNEYRFVSVDDRDRFVNYMKNDKYLNSHQGQYAEAYSVYSPWVHKVDFHYSHDFKIKVGKNTNTLQLNLDIKNVLNIFHSRFGVAKYLNPELNDGNILNYEGLDAEGYPTYSTIKSIQPGVQTWTPSYTIGQCWSAQVGIKYMFN